MDYKLATIDYRLAAILLAFILDLILGDPQWRWHPVRVMGRLIEWTEKRLNTDRINKRFGGLMLVILVMGATIFSVWSILKIAKLINPIFYFFVSVLLIYFALSIKSLAIEADKVYQALEDDDISQARKNLSMIVARDTEKLEQPEIIRATVETVAESIMDGIVAPLFYAFLGGPVLAWAYKAINTLDSMVGYRSERFIYFGNVAAKLDGWVNLIPAKITAFLISLSAGCFRKNGLRSMKWSLRYLPKGPQDNSEATEAAMAAALEVQAGGLNFYQTVPIQKKIIGDNINPLHKDNIKDCIKIAYLSSILCIMVGLIPIWVIGRG